MSAVTAEKFHGSQIAVLVGFAADSPAPAITAITAANPPVVTDSGHALVDGDVIEISGIVGMTELNGRRFVVEVIDSSTFSLLGVDASGYTAYVSGGIYQKAEFTNFCNLTNYNRTGGTSPEIPTTALCSTAQEFVAGLADFGTTAIDYNFDLGNPVQDAIEEANISGDIIAIRVTFPSGKKMVQMGFVQQTSESAGVGGLWNGSSTIRNTGQRWDFDA